MSMRRLSTKTSKKKGVGKSNVSKTRREDEPRIDAADKSNKTKSTHSSLSDDDGGVTTVFSYRLSCAFCDASVDYIDDTERKVVDALGDHYVELWQALGERRHKRADSVVSDLPGAAGGHFGHSPLGQHLLEHCKGARTKDEVVKWCQDNVRVQVKRHMYETLPKTDGSFSFAKKEEAPNFVKNKQERESEWEGKKRIAELEKQLRRASDRDNKLKETFDVIWNERYNELVKYAEEHDGDTKVPQNYGRNMRLGHWAENQRIQYRRKHNGTDKNPALTDTKEELLNDVGFVWSLQPKSRNDGLGIAVMYGYTPHDFNSVSGAEAITNQPCKVEVSCNVDGLKTVSEDNTEDSCSVAGLDEGTAAEF